MSCISKEVKSYKEEKLLTLLKVEASSFSAMTSEQGFLSKEPFPSFLVQLCASVHAFWLTPLYVMQWWLWVSSQASLLRPSAQFWHQGCGGMADISYCLMIHTPNANPSLNPATLPVPLWLWKALSRELANTKGLSQSVVFHSNSHWWHRRTQEKAAWV